MHGSSLRNMQRCIDTYLRADFCPQVVAPTILDIGSMDVNGTYRDLSWNRPFRYVGADMVPGPGVDLVLHDPYKLPLPDRSCHLVISGQMLEHCEFFWLAFTEMVRVLDPDGFIFLIAPSAGPIHRDPVDCYRFQPDSYRALAKWTNCHLIESWRDEESEWCDLVGVFTRFYRVPAPKSSGRSTAA